MAVVSIVVGLTSACASPSREHARQAADSILVDAADRGGFRSSDQLEPPASSSDDSGDLSALPTTILEHLREPLTEMRAVQIALIGDRWLWSAYEKLAVAQAELEHARRLMNPMVSANLVFFSPGEEVESALVLPLIDSLIRPLRARAAEGHWNAARAHLTQHILERVFAVRRSFLDVETATRELAMRDQILEAAVLQTQLTEQLHAAGNIPQLDLTAARTLEASARLDFAAAEVELQEARESLNAKLGLFGAATDWELAEPVAELETVEPSLERIETRAITASLDLAELRGHANAAAQRARIESWETAWGTSGVGLAAFREDGEWGFGPALRLTIPLFDDGSADRAKVVAELRGHLERWWAVAVEIRSQARRLAMRIRSLNQRVEYEQQVYLPLRAQLVRDVLKNYNAMQVGAFDVIVIRQREIEARGQALQTWREARVTALDLDELLAGRWNPERSHDLEIARTTPAIPERGEH